MDTVLARTFLEIVSTGSFQRAAERLHLSQTAVSARMRTLEEHLGQPLFVRNKSGATLTKAGERFLRYAPTLVQLWQRARHDVTGPEGFSSMVAVGGELALWNPLLLRWILRMKQTYPALALKTVVGVQDALTSAVAEGNLDLAIVYTPRALPGLNMERVVDDKLVMVTTDVNRPIFEDGRYVYVDWGPDFATQHDIVFPGQCNAGLLVGLGPLGLNYILQAGGTGYFRMSSVRSFLTEKRLTLVTEAPEFSYPAYAVYPLTGKADALDLALEGLRRVGEELSRDIAGIAQPEQL